MTVEPIRREVPTLEPGVTVLRRPSARSPALYELVVGELTRAPGRTLWIDARNSASTYAIADHAVDDRLLDDVEVARAFTAYQHHSLVTGLVEAVDGDTCLIVVPCPASLYRDDDVPDAVGRGLLDASMSILGEIATTFDVPVLVTVAGGESECERLVVDGASREVTATVTDQGVRFDGPEFETQVYWRDGYFQTTIPYWVDLFGCVCGDAEATPRPVEPAPIEG